MNSGTRVTITSDGHTITRTVYRVDPDGTVHDTGGDAWDPDHYTITPERKS